MSIRIFMSWSDCTEEREENDDERLSERKENELDRRMRLVVFHSKLKASSLLKADED